MENPVCFLEILEKVSFDWNIIIDKIKLYYIGTNSYKTLNGSNLALNTVPSYPNCKTLDLFDYLPKILVPTQVFIYIKKTDNLLVDLYLLDKNFASKRSVKSELFAYNGPKLTSPDLKTSKWERLILKITQIKDAAEDESNSCQDYPIEKFQTFKECDAHFINKQMRNEGVMPFWATDNIEEVTALRSKVY